MLEEGYDGMQNLTLVGLSEDGASVILESGSGERFTVPVDEALRTAVQGPSAGGPTQAARLEMQMDTPLRPRDIQARIRSGETPESVAAAAGTDVERVMTFARPVLAERAHIAERAQRASVRGRLHETGTKLLGDAVSERMRSQNTNPETVVWDAWRREDGRWTLIATLPAAPADGLGEAVAPETAEFVFDTAGRYVLAENDTARWLSGEDVAPAEPAVEAEPEVEPEPMVPEEPPRLRRLSAVADEEELPLGADALKLVTDASPAEAADWIATQASERSQDDEATEVLDPEALDAEEAPAQPEPRKTRRNRTSVPSWDEIMFGSGPTE